MITFWKSHTLNKNTWGVKFHSTFVSFQHWPQKHFTHSISGQIPIPLLGINELYIYMFKWMLVVFFLGFTRKPLNAVTNGLVVVDTKDG
jgi:hypothetical protein